MFRRFKLVRTEDVSNVSGTGVVAQGCVFSSGTCVLNWLGKYHTTGIYSSIVELIEIHGHEGRTQVEFLKDYPDDNLAEAA